MDMKEKFLFDLQNELKRFNVDDAKIESIIKDYNKTFTLGEEAGLSDGEILSKLGSPRAIASEYGGVEGDAGYLNDTKFIYDVDSEYDVNLNLIFGTVEIRYHNLNKIVVIPDEENDEYFEISFDGKKLKINNTKKVSFVFRNNRKGNFMIYLPLNIPIGLFVIDDVNSNVNLESVDAKTIKINTVNGKLISNYISSKTSKISTVNGKVTIDNVNSDNLKISSVNGVMRFNNIVSKSCDCSNVTGSIIINSIDESIIKTSNVVGKISINKNEK